MIQNAVDRANVDRIVSCKFPQLLTFSPSCGSTCPISLYHSPYISLALSIALALTRPSSHSPSLSLGVELISVLLSLIQPSGEVSGDQFGETDSRFTYVLLNALSLLGRLDDLDTPELYGGKARGMLLENLRGCMNFDGGFGSTPGGESHGGQSESFSFSFPCFALPRLHVSIS